MLWLNGAILTLVVLVVLALQVAAVQQYAAKKLTAYLAGKINSRISIGRFTTDWRNSIVLKDIYLEDQHQDTLLYAGRLGLDLNIFALSNEKIKIRSVKIENGFVNLNANLKDSTYNFSFLAESFKGSSDADTSNAVSLKIANLELKAVRYVMSDPVQGNFVKARIGKFSVHADAFDTRAKTYDLGDIRLENSRLFWQKTKIPDPLDEGQGLLFSFHKIQLKNLKIDFLNLAAGRRMKVLLGTSELRADKIALENARADLNRFYLDHTSLQIFKLKVSPTDSVSPPPQIKPAKAQAAAGTENWGVWLKKAQWKKVSFQFYDFNEPELQKGLDFRHMAIKDVSLDLENMYYSQGRISGNLADFQLLEKSGFRVRNLRGKVKAGPDFLELKSLEMKTNYSVLLADIAVSFPSIYAKPTFKSKVTFVADLQNAQYSPKDLLYLAPDLAEKPLYKMLGKQVLKLNGRISGEINDLNFRNVTLKGWTGTTMVYSGRFKDLQREASREMHLQFRKFQSNRQDLNLLFFDGASNPDFRFPEHFAMTGNVDFRPNNIRFQDIVISGSNGLKLQCNGQSTGLSGNRQLSLQVKELVTGNAGVQDMLPPGTVSPEVQLPDKIQFSGKYQGSSMEKFALDGTFHSSFGQVYTNIKITPQDRYTGSISLDNFDLGKFLKEEKSLGPSSGKADFYGQGYKVKTMKLHYKADMKKFVYQGDTYHNIRLEGDLNEKIYQLHGNLSNAALQGLGHKLKKLKPKNLDIKNVKPKKIVPKFLRKKKK